MGANNCTSCKDDELLVDPYAQNKKQQNELQENAARHEDENERNQSKLIEEPSKGEIAEHEENDERRHDSQLLEGQKHGLTVTKMRDDSIVTEVWNKGELVQSQGAQVKRSDGTYQLRSETASQEFADKSLYRGDFKNGFRSGDAVEVKQNGEHTHGTWVQDKLQGYAVVLSTDSSMVQLPDPQIEGQEDVDQNAEELSESK